MVGQITTGTISLYIQNLRAFAMNRQLEITASDLLTLFGLGGGGGGGDD